ncbi:PREDICTED: uncharacterized protein LOC105557337 [Vollenhovia emeryi]|uniref:uncharacterized protein LOC105557337 n=1 Tax=Vollenhovia emeryi TaxID=411798 RepID=UPI0005F4679F|nr:PREDICTED: uncharacterized protein LOC105557337 [Vollenhovia emeryi]
MIGNTFLNVENFYTYPLNSSILGIVRVSEKKHVKRSFALTEFVVIKFINETKNESNDDTDYEVGLAKWITDLNEDMIGMTKWPPPSINAGKLIRREVSSNPNWPLCCVEVIRYFETIKKAREMLKKLVDERLTSYETEKELGRGKRKKRPRTIYTEDSDSDVPIHNKKKQSLSDDSGSDSVQHKKIKKFSKSRDTVNKDIPPPPPLSFQHRSISPNQNDRNRKIIATVAHKSTGTTVPLIEKIKSGQTNRQELFQELKEGYLKNTFKKQKSTKTVPQPNVKSPLRVNATLHQENINNMGDEKENVIDESEVQSNLGIFSEWQNSFNNSESRYTEVVRPNSSTPLKSPLLHNKNPRNEISRPQLFSCQQEISQNANDIDSLSSDISKRIKEIKSLCKTTLVRVEEMSSKVDVTIMNQVRLNRSLLPADKRIIRPSDLPALPIYTEDGLKTMETFLEDDSNL